MPVLCVCRGAAADPPESCRETSEAAGTLTVTVDRTDGDQFGVLIVLVDYPEELVFVPGAGDEEEVQAVVTDRPTAGAPHCVVNDRDDALQVGCLGVTGFPEGRMFRVAFRDCAGGEKPAPSRFTCTVLEAADRDGRKVPAHCTLTFS